MNRLSPRILLLAILSLFIASPAFAGDGSVVKISAKASPMETVEKLKNLIAEKRLKVFSVQDHGGKNSVKQVIAFGSTNHHSRILWHDPAAALELPIKIAVIQDDVGTQVVYRKPTSLRGNYSVEDCSVLDDLDGIIADLAQKAAQ